MLFRETFEGAVFVLEDAGVYVAGDADVEGAGWAAHDVGVAGLHVWGEFIVSVVLRAIGPWWEKGVSG